MQARHRRQLDTNTLMHMQGLFERHKLIVASQLCIAVLKRSGQLSQAKFEFLLRGPRREGVENPMKDWLPDSVWASIQALKVPPLKPHCLSPCVAQSMNTMRWCANVQDLDEYGSLPDDLAGSAKRWQEWMELERPEEDLLPGARACTHSSGRTH